MFEQMNEARRLDVLRRYSIVDTQPEEVFDRIARIAARCLRTPMGTVGFVDGARQWFKAAYGLKVREIGRDTAFCNWAIEQDEVFVILDAAADPRFMDNPLVAGTPHLRFYAGAPMITVDGYRIGTVAVLDYAPRTAVDGEDLRCLADLAAQVVHELEMRLASADVREEIAERQRMEKELDESNRRFQAVLANAPVILCAEDRFRRYTWVANLPAPFKPEDFLGKRDEDIWPPATAQATIALKSRVLTEGQAVRGSVQLPVSGQDRRFEFLYEPVREGDTIIGMTGVGFDVTARYEAQQALNRALAKARDADVAKSRFLAAASHDLRQPVQSLFLLLAVLDQRLEGHPAGPVATAARDALDALRGLLDNLLDISKLEAGMVSCQIVPLPLAPLLTRLALDYGGQAEEKGLTLSVRCADVATLSDPVLLERIVRNLVENAVRYTESGRVLLACRRHRGHVRIDVVDTGHGIPAERLDEVFHEFVQLENPERDRSKGLGLGLAIVRRLTDLLGHRLTVRSRLGHGTHFTLTLPLTDAVTLADEEGLKAGRRKLAGRVLVIEDEIQVARSLALALTQSGLEVVTAESAETALGSPGDQAPDTILADFRLREGHTGIEAIEAVRGHYEAAIPAVLITGDTSPDRLKQAEASGCPLLHKPVPLEQLLDVVARMLPLSPTRH